MRDQENTIAKQIQIFSRTSDEIAHDVFVDMTAKWL